MNPSTDPSPVLTHADTAPAGDARQFLAKDTEGGLCIRRFVKENSYSPLWAPAPLFLKPGEPPHISQYVLCLPIPDDAELVRVRKFYYDADGTQHFPEGAEIAGGFAFATDLNGPTGAGIEMSTHLANGRGQWWYNFYSTHLPQECAAAVGFQIDFVLAGGKSEVLFQEVVRCE